MRSIGAAVVTMMALGSGLQAVHGESEEGPTSRARWSEVRIDGTVTRELVDPEGRTAWDLRDIEGERTWVRSLRRVADESVEWTDDDGGKMPDVERTTRYVSTGTSSDVDRWLFPATDARLLDTDPGPPLELLVWHGRTAERLRITLQRVGMGWLYLPTGPREVVLQRALLSSATANERSFAPERLVHRWVDPRSGVVAQVAGPASRDGRTRLEVDEAAWVTEPLEPQAGLRVYDFMMDLPPMTRVTYGYDRQGVCTVGGNSCVSSDDCVAGGGDACTIPVSVLTDVPHSTIGGLVSASSWNFSANGFAQHRFEVAQTISPVNSSETCSYNQCGFNLPDVTLGRQDGNFDDPQNANITTTVLERELRVDGMGQPTDVTLWLRAGVNKEGQTGSLGEGESRLCYVGDGRTEVPLWRFPHQDALGWYWMLGDSWSSDSNLLTPEPDPFLCENDIFVHTCPNSCGLFCRNWIGACSGYSGTQGSTVVGEGPVTLPSGHTFDALVVRNVAEFCVYIGSSCASPVFRVRTVVYLWEVPWLGTVVRLTSAQNVTDYTSFASVEETDIKFGLFPPRSMAVGAVDDTSVEVTWNPSLDTHRVDGYKVYWSDTSGAFSDTNSLVQPAAMGTSAVVPGLTPGTTYYFTVTALSDYTNPKTLATTTYESLKFPLTAPALPEPVPMEVSATTTGGSCTPSVEVSAVTADRLPGDEVQLCWASPTDPCLDGYQILGAASPETDAGFAIEVSDTGLATCHTFSPSGSYFLVVAKGSGGTGPWGHYGR